ncbi:MAG: hypothetical protein IBJ07_12230 [Rhizobiaceae bacterium]|nr:hypothetical protein [Rhizobiaceae bacterium]
MYILALFASIAGYAALAIVGGVPVGHAVLTAICTVALLLYAASLLAILEFGSYAILCVGLAALLLAGWRQRKKLPKFIKQPEVWTLAAITMLLAIFVSKWLNSFEFLSWDEFSHWGLISKYIVAENRLFDTDSPIKFLAYPPGTALLQYHFSKSAGYSEGMVLLAQVTLFVTAIVAAISLTFRTPLIAIAASSCALFVTYALGFQLYEATVDHILGALLGAVVAVFLTYRSDWRTIAALAPVLAFLPLVKHVGLAFAAVGLGVTLVALVTDFIAARLTRREARNGALAWLCGAVLTALAHLSWRAYYNSLGVTDSYGTSVNLRNALEFFLAPSSDRHLQIWQEFSLRFMAQPSITLALLVAASVVYVLFVPRAEKLKASAVIGATAAGSVAFTMLLLLSYGYYFSEYEAVRLASFERYLNSYYLAWAFALVAAFFARIASADRVPILFQSLLLTAAVLLLMTNPLARLSIFAPVDGRLPDYASRAELRHRSQGLAKTIDRIAEPGEKAFYVDQGSDGYSYFMFRYEMAPRKVNEYCWSLGAPYHDNDIHTCDEPIAELLEGFDYVAIASADDRFWTDFATYFAPDEPMNQSPAVYRVTWANDAPLLSRVEE